VDFRKVEDLERLRELIAGADILIENFKVGGLKKYGLDYDSLSKLNPHLIYCSITGFGQDGPYAHRAGYDYIIQGMSGLMSITGEPDGQPQRVGVAVTDIFTGLYSVSGVLAALYQRERTGRGQQVDMALLDCAVSVTANQAMNYLATGTPPGRTGNYHPNLTPYQVFDCADGFIIIATGNDAQYQRLCRMLDLEWMAQDPRFLSNADRVQNRPEMIDLLMGKTARRSKADLLAACEADGIPAGPINDMADVFDDPQVQARGLRIELDGVPGVRAPFKFSDAELKLEQASPKLGADNG
jgi:crotonobetainyl-CoA:carnitine CoA-transferase CaiB-like acyl-CoA transferase